ncbi:MAG: hypothetical protein V4463_21805 [Pseudomonadota bacterium]
MHTETTTPAAARPRTDMRTRAVVDQAIAAMPAIGLREAAEFLSAMNVSPEVAIRTLVYPHKRRN